MGQAQKNINNKHLDPAIFKLIIDALSHGVARSIINSAVQAMTSTNVTDQVNEDLTASITK